MIGPTIEETTDFIIQAHGEQTRRGKDIPYYTHPIAVSNLATDIAKEFKIPDDVIDDIIRVSLLHDVVEDTPVTIEMLTKMGYPEEVTTAVNLITRKDGETHKQSVDVIIKSGNIITMIVKAADAYHNSIHTHEDIQWCKENNRDAEKDHQRYLSSYRRLLEDLAARYASGNWYLTDEQIHQETDRLLAYSEEMQEKIDSNPTLKVIWDSVKTQII